MWARSAAIFVCISVCLLAALVVRAQDDSGNHLELSPRIIVHKHSSTNPVVEGKDFVITYQLINNGNAVASSIDIADNYDVNSFEMVDNVDTEGFVSQRFEEIAPSSQISFNVTVRPKLFGMYESTRARIRYVNSANSEEDAEDVRQGYSTSLGRTRIISLAEFERSISYFIKEWITVLLLCIIPVALPLKLYLKSRSETSSFTGNGKNGKN